jgi:hypothetical protein
VCSCFASIWQFLLANFLLCPTATSPAAHPHATVMLMVIECLLHTSGPSDVVTIPNPSPTPCSADTHPLKPCSALSLVVVSLLLRCLRHWATSPSSWEEMSTELGPASMDPACCWVLLAALTSSLLPPPLAAARRAAAAAPKAKPVGAAGAAALAPENLHSVKEKGAC